MKAFNTYFVDVIKNHYFDLNGTATRTQFWLFVLFNFLVFLVLGIVFSFLGKLGVILMLLCRLAILLPMVGIAARRLRDAGMYPQLAWAFLLSVFAGWLGILGVLLSLLALIVLIMCIFPTKK